MNEWESRLLRFYSVSRRAGLSLFRPINFLWRDVWIVGTVGFSPDGERLSGRKGGPVLYGYPAAFLIRCALDLPPNIRPDSFQDTIDRSVFYAVDLTATDGKLPKCGSANLPSTDRPLPLLDHKASTSNGGILSGILLRAGLPYSLEPYSCVACIDGHHFFDTDRGTILIDSRTVSSLCSEGAL